MNNKINKVSIKNNKSYILPQWDTPEHIKACVTTRIGGFSQNSCKFFNLANHVGDNPEDVFQNRSLLASDLELINEPMWLEQVHGNLCLPWQQSEDPLTADASFTTTSNQPCVVMTADCLPVLFTNKQGNWIAACHAGWRGLEKGVIENTIANYKGKTADLLAWIGPAISQKHFEVGEEVREQFCSHHSSYQTFFQPNEHGRFQFDFIGLARFIMTNLGICVYGGNYCSYTNDKLFYSYRRDGETGRMASLIWIEDNL
ncbi:MAG: peptidoglycan editing factor PgeF [Gammaproteobacteria bacterium]|nr:peptidoglycan editing factor PgeF [Gammaproteobacteria bacterium]